jgi:hypothetical protein
MHKEHDIVEVPEEHVEQHPEAPHVAGSAGVVTLHHLHKHSYTSPPTYDYA